MQKNISYKIHAQIVNNLPNIAIIIRYKDAFSDDRYILQSEAKSDTGIKSIPFDITRNGKQIGTIVLNQENIANFYNEFLEKTNDYDFNTVFSNEIEANLSREIAEFIKYYEDAIVLSGVTLEGQFRRMQELSGISKKALL